MHPGAKAYVSGFLLTVEAILAGLQIQLNFKNRLLNK